MCTAVSFMTNNHYFGRNLDLEYSYHEAVTIVPRNFPLHFRCTQSFPNHYAMIGMATRNDKFPLYYDGTNEYGLSMAGLNFPGNAIYLPICNCAVNIAPFELIPWVLCQCKTVSDVYALLKDVNIASIAYSEEFPLTPLHWIVSDKTKSITLEPVETGLIIYDNPIGILANNPPFPYHMENLRQYLNLTCKEPDCSFSAQYQIRPSSHGIGAVGLPGDFSSASRFIRAAIVKENSVCEQNESSSVSQFFHILQTVQYPCGCVRVKNGNVKTVYSSCCSTSKGVYYYTTYEDPSIYSVHMDHAKLDGASMTFYEINRNTDIKAIN